MSAESIGVRLKDIDLSEPSNIDKLELTSSEYKIGLMKTLFFTTIALFVFFIPLQINGESNILFGVIYNFFIDLFGNVGLWLIMILTIVNAILSIYAKYLSKGVDSAIDRYYEHDSKYHPIFYLLGAVFTTIYTLHVTFAWFSGPEFIVGSGTGGTVIPFIVLAVAWIIPVGAFFMPFLISYGGIDFIGTILEPIMRPVFKVPGKSAVDAISSFVSSSSMAVLITSRLYKTNNYTKKEAATISTCFSAVSVGFAVLVINTAGLENDFIKIYFSSLIAAFIIAAVMVRIPPLSKKENVYYNGRLQTEEERNNEAKFELGVFKRGLDRAVKRAYTAPSIITEIQSTLKDGYIVLPKVITLLSGVGISGLIIAEYTPFFEYLGLLFIPILNLFQVPAASEIAASLPVGIAEMFLPVLLIADNVDVIPEAARYFVTAVSMVQIIFFSETVVVMIATRLPIKFKELIIAFLLRTLIAIPIVSIMMHIMY